MIKIRQMQEKDLQDILSINEQYPTRQLTRQEILSFNDLKEGVCIVAEESSKVVGFLLMLFSEHAASIVDVETDMEHIGGQVTPYLFEAARRIAIQNGVTSFYKTKAFHVHV